MTKSMLYNTFYGSSFCRFTNSLVYYGISLNAGALSGDIFINNLLSKYQTYPNSTILFPWNTLCSISVLQCQLVEKRPSVHCSDGVFGLCGCFFCVLTMDRFGRRPILSGTLLLAGLGLLASVVTNEYADDNQSK